jgi:membrane-bound serine protease (ClpP class)
MMEYYWVWSILLLVLGLGLAILEVFIPSGGILGFLSFCSILAAIILGFWDTERRWVGMVVLAVAIVGLPMTIVMAFKVWPKTAIGRRVLLMAPKTADVMPEDPRMDYLKGLIDRIAETKCEMLPGGAITIDGRTVDAVSEGMPIQAGRQVRVIEVRANRVVVRPIEDQTPSESAQDPLLRPVDDPFDEPPG